MKQKKTKIKVSQVDIKIFTIDNMIIDEKWLDLYRPKNTDKRVR